MSNCRICGSSAGIGRVICHVCWQKEIKKEMEEKSSVVICQECNNPLGEGGDNCNVCKKYILEKLEKKIENDNNAMATKEFQEGIELHGDIMSLCQKCNFENDSSSEFCIHCGTNLKIVKCNKCSSENPVLANFCMHCGIPLKEANILENASVLKEMSSYTAKSISGYTFWNSQEINSQSRLTLLSGMASKDGTTLESGRYRADIYSGTYGLYIVIGLGFFLGLTYDQITEITFAEGDDIKESGNVVGGAVLGGLLLGPVGAIVGGLSQMASNGTKPTLLVIKYELSNKEKGALVFAIRKGDKGIIHKNITSNEYTKRFYKPS